MIIATPPRTMNILTIEDHPIFQQGLMRTLKSEFPEAQIVAATTAGEGLAKCKSGQWNVVIVDLSLPDRDGLEILKVIKSIVPALPILVLTLHREDRFAVRAFRNGADGYLTKNSTPTQLGEAVRKLLKGGKYVSESLAEKLAVHLNSSDAEPSLDKLSDREYQIFGLLARGQSVRSIAHEFNLSVNTVNTYRTRILEKLDMQSTAEVIAYAYRNQLID